MSICVYKPQDFTCGRYIGWSNENCYLSNFLSTCHKCLLWIPTHTTAGSSRQIFFIRQLEDTFKMWIVFL